MTKTFLSAILILFLCLNISGCVLLAVGGAGALGGYAVSRDTIQGNSDRPYRIIWRSALRVAKIKGKVTLENKQDGEIEFEVKPSRVWVKLSKLSESATEIKVKARKYSFPNLKLAEEVFIKIMEDVKGGN